MSQPWRNPSRRTMALVASALAAATVLITPVPAVATADITLAVASVDDRLVLTATTDEPVDGTSTWIGFYDQTTGRRLGYCNSGTVCTLSDVVPLGGGDHTFVAAAGAIPITWTTPPGDWVVSNEVAVPAWEVTLSGETTEAGTVTFTAVTNYAVSGSSSIWVGVYDRTTGARLGYCSSGRTCTLPAAVPVGGGEHQFVASVGPIPRTWGADDPGNWDLSAEVTTPAWTVDLTSTWTSDGKLVFSTTTNYAVNGSASIWVGVYDQTTGTRLGYCSSGRTCTLPAVVPNGAGAHTYVASVGRIPASWNAASSGNWATSGAVIAPAWTVDLTAVEGSGTIDFTATTNYPVNGGSSIWTGVYDVTTGARLGYCSTGTICTLTGIGAPQPGGHQYVAAAGAIPRNWPGPGVWAESAHVFSSPAPSPSP